MLKIYHNTRCRTSRAGLEALKATGKEFEIVEYLKNPLSEDEIRQLIKKTGLNAIDLIRTKEEYFKKELKGKELSEDELIKAIAKEPRLLQRPIAETETKAVLLRPIENLTKLFS